AGFGISLVNDNLKNGIYRTGLLFRNQKRKSRSLLWLNYELFVNRPVTPSTIKRMPQGKDSVRAFVDSIESKHDFIQIKGWAFINKLSTDFTEASLILESNSNRYLLSVTPVRRQDIQSYFNLSFNVDWAGFSVKFKKADLKPGKYQVCIAMLNKKSNVESLL